MAKITLAGRIGNANQRKANTKNGEQTVLELSVADVSIRNREGEEAQDPWYRFTLWGDRADKMAPFLVKGVTLMVTGDLEVRTYTTKEGKVGISKEISRPEFTLLGSRNEQSAPQASEPAQQTQQTAQTQAVDDGFMNIPDGIEGLPFPI